MDSKFLLFLCLLVWDGAAAFIVSSLSMPITTTRTQAVNTREHLADFFTFKKLVLVGATRMGTASGPLFLSAASAAATEKNNDYLLYQLEIKYCTGCKWGLRSFWLAQELLTTFADEPKLAAVTLIPSRPSINPPAVFQVRMYNKGNKNGNEDVTSSLLWDRKEQGGFPEAKELKQLVRDITNPDLYLGHSDTAEKQEQKDTKQQLSGSETVLDLSARDVPVCEDRTLSPLDISKNDGPPIPKPNVAITYCTGCRWLLRSAYYAQELMNTFGEEINSLTLIPSRPPAKGGSFIVTVTTANDSPVQVWNRSEQGGFPEIKQLKQLVRDLLNPEKDLGHIDASSSLSPSSPSSSSPKAEAVKSSDTYSINVMDDEEAEEARTFFGVA